jgi:hypothetical protein
LPRKEVGTLNEQWVQSFVGVRLNDHLRESLSKRDKSNRSGVFVTSETTGAWIAGFLEYEQAKGRPYYIGDRQRFDLCLWSDKRPIGLLEIKHEPNPSKWGRESDLQKLRNAVMRWGQLEALLIFSHRYMKVDRARVKGHAEELCGPFLKQFGRKIQVDYFNNLKLTCAEENCVWHAVRIRPNI